MTTPACPDLPPDPPPHPAGAADGLTLEGLFAAPAPAAAPDPQTGPPADQHGAAGTADQPDT